MLETHLAALRRDGVVEPFYDGDIDPGADHAVAMKGELRAADVFVALASPDYLESSYCYEKEYCYALGRARRNTMHVVAAVIRPCQWKHTRMARYKALPEDGKEVIRWGSRDSAFEDIVNGVRRVVKLAQAAQSTPPMKSRKQGAIKVSQAKPAKAASRKAATTKAVTRPLPRKQKAKVPGARTSAKTLPDAGSARSRQSGAKGSPKAKNEPDR